MPRILFCLDYYAPHLGGAEILFQNLAEGLAHAGWQVQVVTQRVPGAPASESLNGVQVHRVQTFGCRHLFPFLALPAMLRLAAHADLIHTTTFAAAWPAWLAATLNRKPCILTVHEVWRGIWNQVSDAGCISNFLNDFFERTIYWPHYSRYIAVSQATADALKRQGIPHEKIRVIYNGLDYTLWNPQKHSGEKIRQQLGFSPEDYVFLFTGRPGRSKGLPVLLHAFASLNAPQAKLLILASHSTACQKGLREAQELAKPLANRVFLRKPVPRENLPDWVMAADCVCVPSLSEGFGFSAAEACALRKPVIATNNASLPEVIGGKNILAPPGNPQAFADAMQKALRNQFQTSPLPYFPLELNLQEHIKLYREF